MKIICIIPSRIGSTRLARKPLLPIKGKPMIQWTYENALRCKFLDDVIVATDNEEIFDLIKQLGGKARMTDPNILTGTERVANVAETLPYADVIINLQGDEPFIKPSMLESLISPYLMGKKPDMTTLAYPLDISINHQAASAVKVITDLSQNAIYFSRAPIPYFRSDVEVPVYHHIGLYAFTRDFLMIYKNLPQTPLEKAESLEQLRVLEHGYKIQVCLTKEKTLEINTKEEYELAQFFNYDPM